MAWVSGVGNNGFLIGLVGEFQTEPGFSGLGVSGSTVHIYRLTVIF